jgi:hypothetical protein
MLAKATLQTSITFKFSHVGLFNNPSEKKSGAFNLKIILRDIFYGESK